MNRMIPKEFYLHGIKYLVKIADNLLGENDNLGEASYRLEEIRLQNILPGIPLTPLRQEQVFWHEVVHHILREMQSKKKDDEKFVELFSSLLHQALTTMKY